GERGGGDEYQGEDADHPLLFGSLAGGLQSMRDEGGRQSFVTHGDGQLALVEDEDPVVVAGQGSGELLEKARVEGEDLDRVGLMDLLSRGLALELGGVLVSVNTHARASGLGSFVNAAERGVADVDPFEDLAVGSQ